MPGARRRRSDDRDHRPRPRTTGSLQWPWWRLEQRARERDAACTLVDAFGGMTNDALRCLRRFADGRGHHDGLSTAKRCEDPKTRAMGHYLTVTRGRVPATSRTIERAIAGGVSSPRNSCQEGDVSIPAEVEHDDDTSNRSR